MFGVNENYKKRLETEIAELEQEIQNAPEDFSMEAMKRHYDRVTKLNEKRYLYNVFYPPPPPDPVEVPLH